MNARRVLATSGLWGALLTTVILAMSVLIRLGTRIDGDEAVSMLAPDVETTARIVHRLAAMVVGVLAAACVVAAWRSRPMSRALAGSVAGIGALTALLAVVGRYSPGYRIDVVTIINVAGGIGLAVAFWWTRAAATGANRADPVATIALALLLVLAALGAAVDIAAMRGERAFGPLHLLIGVVFSVFALSAAWRQRRSAAAMAVLALCAVQVPMGFAIAGARPLALAWAHALVACALALALTRLAAKA